MSSEPREHPSAAASKHAKCNPKAVELIPVRPHHAPLLMKWRGEAIAQKFNPFDNIDVDELTERLATTGGDLTNRSFTHFRWLIHDADHDLFVGTVSVKAHWRNENAEIGYQVSEAYMRRGYCLQGVRLLLESCFSQGRFHRLFATISTDNLASINLIEKLGFKREGVLRQHHLILDRFIDQYFYGLLRSEY